MSNCTSRGLFTPISNVVVTVVPITVAASDVVVTWFVSGIGRMG